LKITILSNAPWSVTGYGNQVRAMLPRLEALDHELAVISFYGLEGGVIRQGNTRIYPRGQHPYGVDVIDAHTAHFNNGKPGGLCISLMDSWVIDPNAIRQTRWVPLFPVDHNPLPPPIKARIERAWDRIVYSKFGERMVHNAGLSCHYVPHMIDTHVYKPQPQAYARQQLGVPQDAFVVGMVAANKGNPSRKCFQQQLQAFAEFHHRHADTLLYLHTAKGQQGGAEAVNLPELVDYLGLTDCTRFVDQYMNFLGLPDEAVALTYNAFDVLTSVSMGEGFGIPIAEAQACGVPVIVGDWTSMGELCFAGWKIDADDADPLWTPLGAFQFVPRVGAIVDAYEEAYKNAGNLKLKKQARQGALAYDAETVTQRYWKPVLEELEQRIADEDAMPTFNELAGVAV
jgi:glycosyltransferase involved in cell wall biosynthesis